MRRRETGSLEHAVLAQLWQRPDGATPGQVLAGIGGDLAYTTVMTILTRLWKKGLVDRERRGRAFVYRALATEADLTAQRMRAVLDAAGDRRAALSRFVGQLSKGDGRALRRVLDELDDR